MAAVEDARSGAPAADRLAYVFWHAPSPGAGTEVYEGALARWQEALAANPPAGFVAGSTSRLASPPWLAAWPAEAYLDVYLIEGYAALGELGDRAVRGPLAPAHEEAARRSAHGSGGLYKCRSAGREAAGPAPPGLLELSWHAKPPGSSYPGAVAELAGPGRSVWLRQMVLGAGPELWVARVPGTEPPGRPAWQATACLVAGLAAVLRDG
jgi:hypothetical protein